MRFGKDDRSATYWDRLHYKCDSLKNRYRYLINGNTLDVIHIGGSQVFKDPNCKTPYKFIRCVFNGIIMIPEDIADPGVEMVVRIFADYCNPVSETKDFLIDLTDELFCTIPGTYVPVKNSKEVCEWIRKELREKTQGETNGEGKEGHSG